MSLDNARATYPILVATAKQLSETIREKRPARWVSHEDFVKTLKIAGIKENNRTVANKILKPIQAACLEAGLPDLSSLIVKKAKGDFGPLIGPAPGWWDLYVEKGVCPEGDTSFWFAEFKRARDFADWPDQPPF